MTPTFLPSVNLDYGGGQGGSFEVKTNFVGTKSDSSPLRAVLLKWQFDTFEILFNILSRNKFYLISILL